MHHAHIIFSQEGSEEPRVRELLAAHGLLSMSNPNLLALEREIFSIDDARALKEWAYTTAFGSGGKAALVVSGSIAVEAQHALLKLLEEPPAGTLLLFVLPPQTMILPTVRSRAMLLYAQNNADQTQKNTETDARTFLALSLKDRLAHAAKVAENAGTMREFLDGLERELAARARKAPERFSGALESLYLARRYLNDRGASKKMLCELLAMSV